MLYFPNTAPLTLITQACDPCPLVRQIATLRIVAIERQAALLHRQSLLALASQATKPRQTKRLRRKSS